MQISKLDRRSYPLFSDLSNELVYHPSKFAELIQAVPNIEQFANQLDLKQLFSVEKRQILVDVLSDQYKNIESGELCTQQIQKLLSKDTFTVTTGHQLNFLGGPIFFIYKILHTIKLSEKLNKTHPNKHIIPVFWMASEDHDFEEINHTYLFNQELKWENSQGGAVGDYLLEDWNILLDRIHSFFDRFPDANVHSLLKKYEGKNLSEATFRFVNEIFKDYGLIIIDANDARLKQQMIPCFEKEIIEQFAQKAVVPANEIIESKGFSPQVFVRPINLFYLNSNSRDRIIPENGLFNIANSGSYTQEQLIQMLHKNPEKFSPNVVLRPIYQETILPNLAYIGGGGEIAYWIQLKGVFDALELNFPLLQLRNSIQIFDNVTIKKAHKLDFKINDFFQDVKLLKTQFLDRNISEPINFSNLNQQTEIIKLELEKLILSSDPQLKSFAEAEKTKLNNQIENIRQKLQKIEKSKFDQSLKQIEDLKNKLFPKNGLQERNDNFLNFCSDGNYKSFIELIHQIIDPFESDLIILELD